MAMADIIIKKKILFAGFHSDGYDDDVDGDECKITAISLFTCPCLTRHLAIGKVNNQVFMVAESQLCVKTSNHD